MRRELATEKLFALAYGGLERLLELRLGNLSLRDIERFEKLHVKLSEHFEREIHARRRLLLELRTSGR